MSSAGSSGDSSGDSSGEKVSDEHVSVDADNQARYAVGIDLGTTHCVLAYTDLSQGEDGVESVLKLMPIAQLSSPGNVEEREQLPSFMYMAHHSEVKAGDLVLPWGASESEGQDASADIPLVGAIARKLGEKTPLRLVASAKSWLCHNGVDRRSDFLPMNSPDEVRKTSPLQVSIAYLDHLRRAWDHRFPEDPLIEQDVTVTIPASFDPVARELSAEAAKAVGFKHLTLLEEPMAAVYHWVHACADAWRDEVKLGDIILVVDIGGGTTDLSLVAVSEEQGSLVLNRVAVGDHILLGGDNMDLALAYRIKAKLASEGKNIEPWQIQAIGQACRDAKEVLLSDNDTQSVAITIPSRGSRLFSSKIRCELTRDEVTETLIEGFFPHAGIADKPRQNSRSALTQRGLPYAQDPGITRHLAAFLTRQQDATSNLFGNTGAVDNTVGDDPLAALGADPLAAPSADTVDFIKPSAILLNGGVFKAPRVKERIVTLINEWLSAADAQPLQVLEGCDLDLAVGKGASYYGKVRRGRGVRIRGGLASAYYVGIESTMPAIPGMEPPLQALCIAPFGLEETSPAQASGQQFGLVVGEPVHFRFFGSSTRREDTTGTLLDAWEDDELQELPEIQVTLTAEGRRVGEVVPVHLSARVTEVGTLQLEAQALGGQGGTAPQSWQVELNVRD
ncbi:MAG: nucleotide-binding protein [Alteromonadaceae bacterium]|nr:MAG: nucleotide-binding protein [Alteromonadaceae bacterium]